MKKYYFLMLACSLAFAACKTPVTQEEPENPKDTTEVQLTEWEVLDTTYKAADYAIPSHTAFKIALTACAANPTEANIAAVRQKIEELQPKETPYCMVATFNGDPKSRMGFCWFTNDGVTKGVVQLIAKPDATEEDFEKNATTIEAEATQTKGLRYTGKARYIVNASGINAGVRYKYISHKAIATDLTPGTQYSWRV